MTSTVLVLVRPLDFAMVVLLSLLAPTLLSDVLFLDLVSLGAPFLAAAPVARIGAGDWALFAVLAAATAPTVLVPKGGRGASPFSDLQTITTRW